MPEAVVSILEITELSASSPSSKSFLTKFLSLSILLDQLQLSFVLFGPLMLIIAPGTAELCRITLGCKLLSALLANFDKTHSNKTYSYGHIWYLTMPDYQSILSRKFCHHVSWYIIVYQMYHITTLSHHRCPMLKRPEIHFPTNKQQNPQAAKWVIYKVT